MSEPKKSQTELKNLNRRLFLFGGLALMGGGGALIARNLTEQKKFESSGNQNYETTTGDETGEYKKHTEITTDPAPVGTETAATTGNIPAPPSYSENPAYTENFDSNSYGEPTNGQQISDVDLSGISDGGGSGNETIDWETITKNTLRAPAVQLNMPIVPKSKTLISSRQENSQTINDYAIDVPVSFQSGWLNTTAPLTNDVGTSVITGHVNYPNGNLAPMSAIKLLGLGDIVLTTDSAGLLSKWSVTKTYNVDQSEFSRLTNSTDTDGARRLLLVTCQLDSNGYYTKNYAVEAVPA